MNFDGKKDKNVKDDDDEDDLEEFFKQESYVKKKFTK